MDSGCDARVYDPFVTREFTVRDLLVHRSGLGLGSGDLPHRPGWISASTSRICCGGARRDASPLAGVPRRTHI